MAIEFETRRFTAEEYHRMAETGVLDPNERVELLRGLIVPMSAAGPTHAAVVTRLSYLLLPPLVGSAMVRTQCPVRLDSYSEPEPDIAVVRMRDDFYATQHARPDEIHVLVEVADSSEVRDRRDKLPLYAGAGVPEVWLVVVGKRRIEVHRDPAASGYAVVETFSGTQSIGPTSFPDVRFTVDAVFGVTNP